MRGREVEGSDGKIKKEIGDEERTHGSVCGNRLFSTDALKMIDPVFQALNKLENGSDGGRQGDGDSGGVQR